LPAKKNLTHGLKVGIPFACAYLPLKQEKEDNHLTNRRIQVLNSLKIFITWKKAFLPVKRQPNIFYQSELLLTPHIKTPIYIPACGTVSISMFSLRTIETIFQYFIDLLQCIGNGHGRKLCTPVRRMLILISGQKVSLKSIVICHEY